MASADALHLRRVTEYGYEAVRPAVRSCITCVPDKRPGADRIDLKMLAALAPRGHQFKRVKGGGQSGGQKEDSRGSLKIPFGFVCATDGRHLTGRHLSLLLTQLNH